MSDGHVFDPDRWARARRTGVWLLVGVAAALLLGACEPGEPSNTFFDVTTTVDGGDAVPGDGVCEVTGGAGDCSLRAAVDEANAVVGPVAWIRVPTGTYVLDLEGGDDDNVAGDLDLAPAASSLVIAAVDGADVVVDGGGSDSVFDIRSGTVAISGIGATGASGAGVVVRPGATGVVGFATVRDNGGSGAGVDPGGSLRLLQATVSGNGAGGVANAGLLDLEFVTVTANTGGGVTGAGATTAAASIIAGQASGSDCSAPVTSEAGNVAGDLTCGLTGAADVQGAPVLLGPPVGSTNPVRVPALASPAVDLLAAGTGLCVPGWPTERDQRDDPRPAGAGCDAGAVEVDGALALTVNTSADGRDATPGDGVCATATAVCSLRAAIDEANASVYADTISLGRSPVLSLAGGGEDANVSGDLDVVGDLTITGVGRSINGASLDRVIDQRNGHLRLEGTAIIFGFLPEDGVDGEDGAGIRAAGDLVLDSVVVQLNISAGYDSRGGGVAVEPTGTLAMTGGSVRLNRLDGYQSIGGGIANAGTATLTDVLVESNASGYDGGGIASSGTLVVDESIIRTNRTSSYGGGGGVATSGTATITRSTVSANTVPSGNGGAVLSSGTTSVSGSTLDANVASGSGGAVHAEFSSSLAVERSTISANASSGATIFGFGATVEIRSSSLVGNTGYGTVLSSMGSATVAGTVIDAPAGEACRGTVTSGGWNVVSDSTCSFGAAGDQQGVGALVGPLANNGGPTATRLPYSGSPVLDAIPSGTPLLCTAGATDQRGVARPVGAACDVGSVEGSGGPATPLALVVTSAADLRDAAPGDGACATAGGVCTLRAAIDETNAYPTADTITVAPGIDPVLTLAGSGEDANRSGDLDIAGDLGLRGEGATVDAGGLDRVIHHLGGTVRLDGLTVTGGLVTGYPQQGAGILTQAPLTVTGVTVTDNVVATSIFSQPGQGAGVAALFSTLTVERSTISANRSEPVVSVDGSALYVEGATATVTDSTLSGNQGAATIGLDGYTGFASVTVRSSTLADNEGGPTLPDRAEISISGSIVAGAPGFPACTGFGAVVSAGWNLVADTSCAFAGPGDERLRNPVLGPLGDNGGRTATQLPYSTSPVIDAIPVGTAGLCDGARTDQRGVARPAGAACDVGATEGDDPTGATGTWTVDSSADRPDAAKGDGVCDDGTGECTLRAAVDEANHHPLPDVVTIAAGVDPVLSLAGANEDANATGDLDVTNAVSGDLTIVGGGAVVAGSSLDRVIDHARDDLVLEGLTLTGGSNTEGSALRVQDGSATLFGSELRDNASTTYGSVAQVWRGSILLDRSTIVGDLATALYAHDSVVTVRSSTLVSSGAALQLMRSSTTVVSSTLARPAGSPASNYLLYDISASPITLTASIVHDPGTFGGYGLCSRTVVSGGWNRASGAGCGLGSGTDLEDPILVLGAVGDNGGPTRTALPAAGWSGLDAIPVGTIGICDASTPVDQRGAARPAGSGCDIGAVEGTGPPVAGPGSYVVTSAADGRDAAPGNGTCATVGGVCTLRAAIDEANANNAGAPSVIDTITIASGIDPVISLAGAGEDANATGDLDVLGNLVLVGNGATVDGAGLDRVLDLATPSVELRSLTITGGLVGAGATGGGIRSQSALVLDDVVVEANQAGGNGGGLAQSDALEVADSRFADNTSVTGSGGGLYAERATIERSTFDGNHAVGGGGVRLGTGTILSSTVSGNTATSSGGGIAVEFGLVDIVNSTVSENAAPSSSAVASFGIFTYATRISGSTIVGNTGSAALSTLGQYCRPQGCTTWTTVEVSASIIAGAPGAPACTNPIVGSFILAPDGSCGASVAGPHLLGSLADNGGPTQTHLPGAGSAAIDAIPAGTVGLCDGTNPRDQRGVARPQGAACDIGAVEQ